ncbi:virulence-associated protein E [Streptococcus satellite phage Javan297]|uniref:Virulence-associated protein E n=1 Tax=Streptococcus mitis TaxID=28037 RepID=A0A150NP22_STRMT|nr:virulence-associated protein E [Streptococcus mitis]QBX08819.1 virulence-associated protein E [Streptococcus satellite phage Javan297]
MNSNDIVNKIIEDDQKQAPPEVVDLTQARETSEEHNSLDLTPKNKRKRFCHHLGQSQEDFEWG